MIEARMRRAPAPARLVLLTLFSGLITVLAQPGGFDPGFHRYSVFDRPVFAIALQSDGTVLVGGAFTTVTGVPRPGIARVNSHGSLDPSFDPGLGVEGNDSGVYAMAVYTNGTHV